MARKKSSMFEDFTRLPWPIGVAVAAAVYLGMKYWLPAHFSQAELLVGLGRASEMLAPLVAGLFLLAALLSFVTSVFNSRLYEKQRDLNSIRSLSWREFERLIGEAFRRQGYMSVETEQGADGGVDLILHKDNKRYFVQCKHWKARRISVNVVRELYGVIAARGASGGIIVTSGNFTDEARNFAESVNIDLIDGDRLVEIIPHIEGELPQASDAGAGHPVNCPGCGASMVLRTARKGPNAGNKFWGCSRFPGCRTTLSISNTQ